MDLQNIYIPNVGSPEEPNFKKGNKPFWIGLFIFYRGSWRSVEKLMPQRSIPYYSIK